MLKENRGGLDLGERRGVCRGTGRSRGRESGQDLMYKRIIIIIKN